MIRYSLKFNGYFLDYFRNSSKIASRNVYPSHKPQRPISVVTTCMNRLNDLRLTLPKNIEDNGDYPAEFLLLDYDSKDGLEDWVKGEMIEHISSSKLVYYKVLNQPYFRPNHSRNVSFRLAGNEIVANVDSDNYMHKGYLHSINQCVDYGTLVVPESFMRKGTNRLFLRGRFVATKSDIIGLGGFDEDLDDGYSHDDVNFVCRAMLSGFRLSRYDDKFLGDRIETPPDERSRYVRDTDRHKVMKRNADITAKKLSCCMTMVNRGRFWGECTVVKNFRETIILTGAPAT